jgi:hypothetical protein
MNTQTKRTRQEALLDAARLYWRLRVWGAIAVAFGMLCATYLFLSGDLAGGAAFAILTLVLLICLLHGRKYGRSEMVDDRSDASPARPTPTPNV